MKGNTNWLSVGLGLILIGIIGWICIALFVQIGKAPWQFLTILIALLGALISFAGNWQIQIRSEQKEKKFEVYEKIIHFFFEIIFSQKIEHQKKTEEEVAEFLIQVTPSLILWASDDVLYNFIAFRQASTSAGVENPNVMIFLFGKLLLSIRKDLGHQNSKLNELAVLGVFVNDVENLSK